MPIDKKKYRKVIECPKCGHEHCRVIENGRVTGQRFDSRNDNVWRYQGAYATTSWTMASSGGTGDIYLSEIWANSTSASTAQY